MTFNMPCDYLIVVSLGYSAVAAIRASIGVWRLCTFVAKCVCHIYVPALHLVRMRGGRRFQKPRRINLSAAEIIKPNYANMVV